MTFVRFDRLPADITPGELAAIGDATADGWINPPLYSCLRRVPARTWRTVHLRYLERRGLTAQHRYRRDGMCCIRLNAAGMALRVPS